MFQLYQQQKYMCQQDLEGNYILDMIWRFSLYCDLLWVTDIIVIAAALDGLTLQWWYHKSLGVTHSADFWQLSGLLAGESATCIGTSCLNIALECYDTYSCTHHDEFVFHDDYRCKRLKLSVSGFMFPLCHDVFSFYYFLLIKLQLKYKSWSL